jgi:hypothetical protein
MSHENRPDDAEQEWLKMIDAALSLIERLGGDVELARGLWEDAFTEAERLDHNQQMEIEADSQDDFERAVTEQSMRFDQALDARRNFRVVDKTDESKNE